MPRYFFDVEDGVSSPDLDGVDLPDMRDVREEACRMAGRLLEDRARMSLDSPGFKVVVRESDSTVLTVIIQVDDHVRKPT